MNHAADHGSRPEIFDKIFFHKLTIYLLPYGQNMLLGWISQWIIEESLKYWLLKRQIWHIEIWLKIRFPSIYLPLKIEKIYLHELKTAAPGEARTHGLQIMRLTRCLLRYRGFKFGKSKLGNWTTFLVKPTSTSLFWLKEQKKTCLKIGVPTGGLEPPIFGLGDRRLIH